MKKLMNYFHIVLNFGKMTVSEIIGFAVGIKTTGDPDVTTVTYTDIAIQAMANKVLTEVGSRNTDPHPSLTKQEQQDFDLLCRAIVAVKGDVEQQANKKANGNRAIFETIVRRVGFVPKGISKKHQRVFESKTSEKGSFHVSVPSEGRSCTYIFQYGITPTTGVLPLTWSDFIPIPTTELIVSGLQSGSIVGVNYAVVMHPTLSKKAITTPAQVDPVSAKSKVVSSLPINKFGKISITHNVSLLNFSDVIYIVIP